MMRHHRFFTHRILPTFLLVLIPALTFADWTTEFVNSFNAKNGGTGLKYTSAGHTDYAQTGHIVNGNSVFVGESRVTRQGDPIDFSAYSSSTSANNTSFQTFCIAPEMITYSGVYSGQLNYASGSTKTTQNRALTVGVAWLYKEFAAGTLGAGTQYAYNYNYGSGRAADAALLQNAIWLLLGVPTNLMSQQGTNWSNNKFLQLLALNTNVNWTEVYDPANNYGGLMGNAQVFAVQSANAQDILYVTTRSGNDVPEPASLLFWTLGSLGTAGMAYRQRHKTFAKK